MITGRTRVAGVIGWPVAHSLSPVIHAAGIASLGVDAAYVAFAVPPGRAGDAVSGAVALGLIGLSVTMPHKEDVAGCVDESDEATRLLRSANTVVIDGDRTTGHSTDGDGFLDSLHDAEVAVDGVSALVLGSGGAGRAVTAALSRAGARVTLSNRSDDSASSFARDLSATTGRGVEHLSWAEVADGAADHGLIVNCTSLGLAGQGMPPIDVGRLSARHVVADIVYHPESTPLLAAASARGARTVGGLGMLIHQAARQERLWFGATPDVSAMTQSVRRALAGQG